MPACYARDLQSEPEPRLRVTKQAKAYPELLDTCRPKELVSDEKFISTITEIQSSRTLPEPRTDQSRDTSCFIWSSSRTRPVQIERRTSQASARRPSSAMMQGCINLWEKPTVQQVGQDLACSHRWHRRTHGALDPTGRELTVSGQRSGSGENT